MILLLLLLSLGREQGRDDRPQGRRDRRRVGRLRPGHTNNKTDHNANHTTTTTTTNNTTTDNSNNSIINSNGDIHTNSNTNTNSNSNSNRSSTTRKATTSRSCSPMRTAPTGARLSKPKRSCSGNWLGIVWHWWYRGLVSGEVGEGSEVKLDAFVAVRSVW